MRTLAGTRCGHDSCDRHNPTPYCAPHNRYCAQHQPCTEWSQGLFPQLGDCAGQNSSNVGNCTGVVNGGVPQKADLAAHGAAIMEQLPSWIPEKEWAGNAVLDFEAWNPIWRLNAEQNGGKHNRYQLYSIALVGAAHPEWSAEQKEAVARAEFEPAAMAFMVETLRICRELRPNARFGFYGMPLGLGANPEYDRYAQQLLPIWQNSGALYPSICKLTATSGHLLIILTRLGCLLCQICSGRGTASTERPLTRQRGSPGLSLAACAGQTSRAPPRRCRSSLSPGSAYSANRFSSPYHLSDPQTYFAEQVLPQLQHARGWRQDLAGG